jgi:nucleoside 2-deoxyribosyltransferase
MFELNSSKVMEADVFVYVLDGRVPDEGAAVELGMAFAVKQSEKKSKLLVGYRTDNRVAFLGSKLNPMLLGALDFITGHEKELIDYLKSYNFSLSKKK